MFLPKEKVNHKINSFFMKSFIISIICFTIITISCNNSEINSVVENDFVNYEQITKSLKNLSPVFAEVICSSNYLHSQIKNSALEEFDGDYDVLFDTAKNFPVNQNISSRFSKENTFFEALIKSGVTNGRSITNIENDINTIPNLNLFYYSPAYDKEYNLDEILIAYPDYTMDDQDWEFVEAYDKDGNLHILSAKEAPDFPVIVIGISERVGIEDKYQLNNLDSRFVFDGGAYHDETLKTIKYLGKYGRWDPWLSGRPDIYVIYNFYPEGVKQFYDNVKKTNTVYTFNQKIFSFRNIPENSQWGIFMYDYDGGTASDITVSNTLDNGITVSTTVPAHNKDDFMGNTIEAFYHTNPSTICIPGVAEFTFSYVERR